MSCQFGPGVSVSDVTAEIVDCYLTFTVDGKVVKSIPLCGAAISCAYGNVTVCGSTSTGIFSIADLEEMGVTLADLHVAVLACKNPPITIDNAELNVEKFGQNEIEVCNIATGEICSLTKCFNNGVFTYHDSFTDTPYSQAEFQAAFTKTFTPYTELSFVNLYDKADKKMTGEFIEAVQVRNNKTGKIELYACDDFEKENLLNQKNYIMSYETRRRGQLIESSPVLPTPEPFPGTLTFCLAADTDLDIVDSIKGTAAYAAFIAKLPVLPKGLAYGLTQIKGTKLEGQKGMTVDCDLSGATDVPLPEAANTQGSFVTPYDPNNDILPSGSTGIVGHPLKTFEFVDGETCIPCYDVACELVTGDHTANNGSADGAWDYSFCVGCFGTPAK